MNGEETTAQADASSENQLLGLILKGIGELRDDVKDMRHELAAGDEKRVSKEAFEQYQRTQEQVQKATDDRLVKLEGSPMRVLAWLAFAFGFVSPILTIVLFIIVQARR